MTGAASAEISASFPMAGEIETGRPRKDLKAMLETSIKTREVKGGENKGRKYLIIPLRHRISSMPAHVLQKAQALEKSFVAPPGSINPPTRVSATGHTVKRHSYLWGGRLESGLTHKLPQHKTDIFAGMVRFDTSAGKANSSAYMTFRVMGEWQDGWIVGPKPGLYLAKGVAESLRGVLRQSVADAMKNDLTRSSVVTGQ
jgi:hypothetical protein